MLKVSSLKTPIAFFIFNRPELTEQVFQAISEQRPAKLLVVADGARNGRVGESERCLQARAILKRIDWECELLTNFSELNLGCRDRLTSGLNWVFDQVEEAIVLEDDCVPDSSFFTYCEELLERYRDDERVFQICGSACQKVNTQGGMDSQSYSYYFSKINYVWGWASWRRAWKKHDVHMSVWPEVREKNYLRDLGDPRFVEFWSERFEEVYQKKLDTWDYQWVFTSWVNNGLAIVPSVNLIKNIGFGPEATHTHDLLDARSNSPSLSIQFPLRHPPFVMRDCSADAEDMSTRYVTLSWKQKLKRGLKRLLCYFI